MFNSIKEQQSKQHEVAAANILQKQKKISLPKAKITPEEHELRQRSGPLETAANNGAEPCDHCREEYMKLTKAKLQEICTDKEIKYEAKDKKTILVDKILG